MRGQAYVIGKGFIADLMPIDREFGGSRRDVPPLFFCSGVSNSNCTDEKEYAREIELLYDVRRKYGDETIFYFSSIDVATKSTRYYKHKLEMEGLIRKMWGTYVILRIGNIIGDTNPNTFINYIRVKQAKGEPVEIRDEWKYLIDQKTLVMLCQTLPLNQRLTLTVATEIKKVKDCI